MNSKESTGPGESEIDRLWSWVLHEDNLLNTRANFMLAAEALLIAAFAAMPWDNPAVQSVRRYIAALGVVFAGLWLYLSIYQLKYTMAPIKSVLRERLPDYREITKSRRPMVKANSIVGYVLPGCILGLWMILIAQWPG